MEGEIVDAKLPMVNDTPGELTITGIRTTCGCISLFIDSKNEKERLTEGTRIPVGKTTLHVKIDTHGKAAGIHEMDVALFWSNDSGSAAQASKGEIELDIRRGLWIEPSTIQLDDAHQSERTLAIMSDVSDILIEEVKADSRANIHPIVTLKDPPGNESPSGNSSASKIGTIQVRRASDIKEIPDKTWLYVRYTRNDVTKTARVRIGKKRDELLNEIQAVPDRLVVVPGKTETLKRRIRLKGSGFDWSQLTVTLPVEFGVAEFDRQTRSILVSLYPASHGKSFELLIKNVDRPAIKIPVVVSNPVQARLP